MPAFEQYWEGSNRKSINYKGNSLFLSDRITVEKQQKILARRVSTNSEWRQGISLNVQGEFTVNDRTFKKGIYLWEDTAPSEVAVDIKSKDGRLLIKNVWDHGDGVIQSWHNGAAMIIEEIPNGRRYYCNDGHPDENFDDIVFEIIILK